MEIRIYLTQPGDTELIPKIISAVSDVCSQRIPKITIESKITTREEFNLTEAMYKVLVEAKPDSLYASDIEERILNHPDYAMAARDADYAPGGISKGIAASGMFLEKKGKVLVDKSEGPGSYKYRAL